MDGVAACPYPSHPPPVRVSLVTLGEHDCPYLPGRRAMSRALWVSGAMEAGVYHRFMDAAFRRSGRLLYQPICAGCRACMQIRVPVETFEPSKSQRRCWRKNQDLSVEVGEPEATAEKFDLYRRYQEQWHGKPGEAGEGEDWGSFVEFLYDSPVQTVEFAYRDEAAKLIGVGICDVSEASLSSVYFYHDPVEARRGLGTFSVLYEIARAGKINVPYYYLGYWVAGCAAMEYKAGYRPCEMLHADGVWRPEDETIGGETGPAV